MEMRGFVAGLTSAVMIMLAVVAVAPALADEETCGAVLGMSVARHTYAGSTLDEKGTVELIWHPGSVLGNWADASSQMWSNLRTENDCGEPEWATFGFDPTPVRRINGYTGSNQAQFDGLLDAAVLNIRTRWPSIQRLDVWLIVGADHETTCAAGSRTVRATEYHRDVQAGLDDYLARRPDVGAGPEIHIDCAGFSDWIGHLNTAGQAEAGAFLDAWYLAEPETTTTTMTEEPTTTVGETTTVVEEPTTTAGEATTTLVEEPTTTLLAEPTTTLLEEPTTTLVEEPTTTLVAEPTTTVVATTTTEDPGATTTTFFDTTTTLPACEPSG